eukprot:221389_1
MDDTAIAAHTDENEHKCASCISFLEGGTLHGWLHGDENDCKPNQQLIKRKIKSKIKPTAAFRIYPKLKSLSNLSRLPYPTKQVKRKLIKSYSTNALISGANSQKK